MFAFFASSRAAGASWYVLMFVMPRVETRAGAAASLAVGGGRMAVG
jgi:hypothetical protein